MKKFLTIVFLCLFVSLSGASAKASSEILKTTLDNGLIVVIKQMPDKDVAAMELLVRAGSIHEAGLTGSGVSHFLEHMLFKGTKTRPTGTLQKQIKDLGAYFNAYTSHDYAGYYIVGPEENLSPCLEILADAVLNSEFDAEEFKKEQKVILREIAMGEDDPDRQFSRLIWSNTYTTHPYRHPVIGYEELLKGISREELIAYHAKKYVPNNLVLSITSPDSPEDMLAAAKEAFSKFKRKAMEPVVLPKEPTQVAKRQIHQYREDIKLSRLALTYHTVPVGHEDLFALDVLAVIMGQGESSRLNRSLRVEKELVYGISSSNYTPMHPGIFAISASLEQENLNEAKDAVLEEVEKLKNKLVSPKELKKAKRQVLASYLYGLESPRGVSHENGINELLVGNPEFSHEYVDQINKISAKMVQEVCKKYLIERNLSVISLSPHVIANHVPPTRWDLVPPRRWDMVNKHQLENGITLLIKEDKRLPIVSIQACFLGGLRFENEDISGIGSLMSSVLTKGTKTKTAEEIAKKLESMGAAIGPYSGNNSFGVSMKLISEDLQKGMEIFSDIILNPSFDKKELEREKATTLAAIRVQQEDVFQEGFDLLKKGLFKEHPYRLRLIGSEESIKGITQQDMHDFHKRITTTQNMVLSVFGDVDVEEVVELVERHFSSMNQGPRPKLSVPTEAGLTEVRKQVKRMPKQQAVLIFGFLGMTLYDNDRYPLDVLISTLSGDAGRLYKRIRQEKGQAYIVGASATVGLDPGYIYIYAATSPENAESVKQEALRQVAILSSEPISDEELNLAKNDLAGAHRRNIQTNSSLALSCSLDELYGFGFDNYKNYEEKINAVSKDDVMRVAAKYLKKGAHVFILILPDESAQ